jgi:hypothetical protein
MAVWLNMTGYHDFSVSTCPRIPTLSLIIEWLKQECSQIVSGRLVANY